MSVSDHETMPEIRRYTSENRRGWNLRAVQHFDSEFYAAAAFREGQSSLHRLEIEEVGDVTGQSLLHLQCHFGLDTMSWSRLGAKATGVDISDEAIAEARSIAAEVGLDTRFIRSDIYDLPNVLDEQFDVVYASYGALVFMPDLTRWAQIAAGFLKPGGRLCVVEIHPVLPLFTEVDGELRLTHPLFHDGPAEMEVTRTYADLRPVEPHTEYFWRWTVGSLATALLDAGLRIDRLRELPIDMRQRFPSMVQDEDGAWRLPGDPLPLVVTFVAGKPHR